MDRSFYARNSKVVDVPRKTVMTWFEEALELKTKLICLLCRIMAVVVGGW